MSYSSISEATGFLRSVKKQVLKSDFVAARLAAQFGRENRYELVDRVAKDAVKAADLVMALRTSRPGKARTSLLSKLRVVCVAYGATIAVLDTLAGPAVDLQFPGGQFSTRAGERITLP